MSTKLYAVKTLAICTRKLSVLVLLSLSFGTGCKESPRSSESGKRQDASSSPVSQLLRGRAEAGDLHSQYELGMLYRDGVQVRQDYVVALGWLRKAAERGHANAQVALSTMYRLGLGTSRQDSEALKWALKAAEQGNLDGQKAAAVFYTEGDGIPVNWPEAFKWTLKAAKQNDPAAKYNLGFSYGKGLGVTQDMAEAYKWFTFAVRDGYEDATNALGELRARMSEAEVAEGIRRSSQVLDPRKP